jgi:REP element-mobilizing transposase RayT
MPNHIHGIIRIKNVGAGLAPALNKNGFINRATARVAPTNWTLGKIVGIYKSKCCTEWLKYLKNNKINEIGSFWQRNYYEHIIRNEMELGKIREYIRINPMIWERDRNNPKNQKRRGGARPLWIKHQGDRQGRPYI